MMMMIMILMMMMMMKVDSDGSGSIEFLEFLLLMGRILKDVPTDSDLRDVFTGQVVVVVVVVVVVIW